MSEPSSLFANLDESALRALSPNGVIRSFPKGAILVNEGDGTDSLYVLISGRVKAFLSDEQGREVILNTIGAGSRIGRPI